MYSTEELELGVGFVGNYLPRKCGIATFTYDLAESVARKLVDDRVVVVAMNDYHGRYDYPGRVKFQVRENRVDDYVRAAHYLNESGADVACLQHEYGIFGKPLGINVLTLLRNLRLPLVVTCHTVLARPSSLQREILEEIVARAAATVVMSRRAAFFLRDVYGARPEKVEVIPHGIHPFPYVESDSYKAALGLQGRRVLFTFGLLGRNKGIEHMIEAMPAIVDRIPEAMYVVLGKTHPVIVRDEGESYREGLLQRVHDLGLEDHVTFRDEFVELEELLGHIAASDVCITPYLTLDHISSGALSYALAMGRACVSTPYWYATELLADGRGRLVPAGDYRALVAEILAIFGDELKTDLMRRRAYAYCQRMSWPNVAASYVDLFNRIKQPEPEVARVRRTTVRGVDPRSAPL